MIDAPISAEKINLQWRHDATVTEFHSGTAPSACGVVGARGSGRRDKLHDDDRYVYLNYCTRYRRRRSLCYRLKCVAVVRSIVSYDIIITGVRPPYCIHILLLFCCKTSFWNVLPKTDYHLLLLLLLSPLLLFFCHNIYVLTARTISVCDHTVFASQNWLIEYWVLSVSFVVFLRGEWEW